MHAFDVLGDPVRRRILEFIGTGEKTSGDVVTAIQQDFGITQAADATAPNAAEEAFKRVTIPAETRARIEAMLGTGSSLTITDTGTEAETGQGTDFITVTQEMPRL